MVTHAKLLSVNIDVIRRSNTHIILRKCLLQGVNWRIAWPTYVEEPVFVIIHVRGHRMFQEYFLLWYIVSFVFQVAIQKVKD